MCTQKKRALSYIGAEKITFPPKPDRQTYRRTDISVYRVASLLKTSKYGTLGGGNAAKSSMQRKTYS